MSKKVSIEDIDDEDSDFGYYPLNYGYEKEDWSEEDWVKYEASIKEFYESLG